MFFASIKTEASLVSHDNLDRYARIGLWALPLYGLANLIGTLSSQPDYHKNFPPTRATSVGRHSLPVTS
jgi:hypothetical protein